MPQQPESVAEWLVYAKSHLLSAQRSAGPDTLWAIPCFEAQQAAEKAIKAVLTSFRVVPPKTHSVEYLIDLLPADAPRSAELLASRSLTAYATVSRYPWSGEPVTEERRLQVLRLAEAVIAWAEAVIGASET